MIMRILRTSELGFFSARRRYIGKYLIGAGVAAALIALCLGWLVYDAAAQTNDGTQTVGECLANANIPSGLVGGALVKEDIIGENLLTTKVTNGMCQDMLERAPDGTPVQSLVAAQNYIQEIKLIENAIHQAAGRSAAMATERHLLGDESLVLVSSLAEVGESVAEQQYPDDETPSGGDRDGAGVRPSLRQAATASSIAASVVAEGGASIAEMLDQIEAALAEAGTPRSEVVSEARCALEEALLNATSKEISRGESIRVNPDPAPKEMKYGGTITVKLFVSDDIRKGYETLEGQYDEVAKASEANDGCVHLDKSVEAALHDDRFGVTSRQGSLIRPITHDTTWRWDLTANTKGKNTVSVLVGHVLQHAELELQPQWVQPAPFDTTIIVKTKPLAKASNPASRDWRWLLPVGIVLTVATAWLVGMLRKRERRRPGEPEGQG